MFALGDIHVFQQCIVKRLWVVTNNDEVWIELLDLLLTPCTINVITINYNNPP
jgi:hypothetical protein